MSLDEIIINMIIVSVPEEFLMVLITLILMRRYDFIDRYNIENNLKKIMFIAVIPCVILFSYTLYGLELNFYLKMIINAMVFYVLMLLLLKSKEWLKLALFSMLSMFIVIILELTVNLILVYVFNLNTSVLNISPWINFIVVLPVRIIQFSIIYMIYLKKNALVNISILNIWMENLAYRRLIFLCLSVDICIGLFMYKEFTLEKSIEGVANGTQIFIIIALFILLVMNIVIPWITVLITYPSGAYKRRLRSGG